MAVHRRSHARETWAMRHLISRERFFINAIAAMLIAMVALTVLSAAGVIR
jgi:hypothetical protein